MKAVIANEPGALQIAELPSPAPGPGQLRIRVQAAAVNPVDLATRDGHLTAAGLVAGWPLALGWDVAGVVDALGPEVDDLALGDAVIGIRNVLSAPGGTHAESVVLDRDAVARAPLAATPAEASTLPLNGLTAMQALDLVALAPGQTLLVTGAGGAVGGYLVQLGALRGLHVVAVAPARDEPLLRELGATTFVGRTDRLGQAVRAVVPGGVDATIDAAVIGVAALDAVRDGGAYVALVGGTAPAPLRGTRVHYVWIRADRAQLAELVALVDAGRLTLRVADVLPLDAVASAYERVEAGGIRGRLVLTPEG